VRHRRVARGRPATARTPQTAHLRTALVLVLAALAAAGTLFGAAPAAQASAGRTGSATGAPAPGLRPATARVAVTGRESLAPATSPRHPASGPTATGPQRSGDRTPPAVASSAGQSPDGAHHLPVSSALPPRTASPGPPGAPAVPEVVAGTGPAGRTLVAVPARSPPAAAPPSPRRLPRPVLT
jgi:hypothetical protein